MILNTKTVPTIVSEGLEASVMGINTNKIAMLSRILRDSIYSDKIGGIIREYSTNIFDEHKKHIIEKPAEIGIRQENGASIFYARDFAKGLSEHDIRNVFGMYLESTKDKTNDLCGQWGIGSKIFLSYTDTFYIISHFEGVKTTYIATLDAGEGGESISKILKVGEEPTKESGIEISAEIKKGDSHKFETKIREFITYCNMSIIGDCPAGEYIPQKPKLIKTHGDYTFKVFEHGYKNVIYRMGNITYKTECLDSLNHGTNLVIEIPIGRMTIPVSREAFEETKSNERILKEIQAHIQALEDEDMAGFRNYSVDDLLKDRAEDYFKGQIFTCKKSKIFPNTAQILGDLQKTMFGENTPDFELHEGKIVIGIIPNNKAKDMWRDRLMDYSKEQNKQYWSIVDNPRIQEDVLPQMIKDYFVFKKVKSKFFPLRKAESAGNKMSFVVYEKREHWNTRKDSYTALNLHNDARSKLKLEEAEDLEEAALQMQEQQYPDFKTLNMFTINDRNAYGSKCPYWWTSSQKMRDQMKAIGWFILHDVEYTEIFEVLKKIEDKKTEERDLLENCYPRYIDCPVVTKRKIIIPKRLDRARKIKTMLKNMESENSLRGKILKGLSSDYYGPKIDRHELRNILKLRLTTKPVGV